MMRKYFSSIFLLILIQIAYSQTSDSSKIIGVVHNLNTKVINIGDDFIPLSDSGKFTFVAEIKNPRFFEVSYGNLYWLIYLEPGKTVQFELLSSDLNSMSYQGELLVQNDFLIKSALINTETNDFFNENWIKIHSLKEFQYISVIDSLKQLFLKPLVQIQNKNIPEDFKWLFKADVNFSFNTLIVQYPQKHFKYANEKIILSHSTLDFLNKESIDDIQLIELKSYKRYCKTWIDYNTDLIVDKINGPKHYNLKKMDVLFDYLPTIFKNQVLNDYWLSEYMEEHIQNTWLANSEEYVTKFNSICETDIYKSKINNLYNSYLNEEKDHTVKIFKTENDYILEANIFYPDGIGEEEKKPAIVIFHGGGLVIGNPSWAFGKAKHYAEQGLVAVAAQYRLSNFKDITPIDAIQDAKDLMFWLRKNADELKIIDNKIAASGWSMGAQLCATLAIFPDTLSDSRINTSPNALLLTSPGTHARGWFTELLNGAKINPMDYSPLEHVKSGLPPTIILQGRDDTVTPLNDVQLFYNKMITHGNYCEIWIYDKVGHLFTPTYLGDNGWPQPDKEVQKQADERADEFLKKFDFIEK